MPKRIYPDSEKKKTNPDYKYSQALKDAKATYKK